MAYKAPCLKKRRAWAVWFTAGLCVTVLNSTTWASAIRRRCKNCTGEFSAIAHLVDVRLNHRVVGGQGQQSLQVLDEHEQLQQVGFDQLLLCAGCYERSVPFPGWTTPGVIMLGGLQLQIKSGVVKPKGPTLIAGTGPLLMLVACQLHAAGVEVAGVYEACEFGRIAKQSLALLNQPQLFLDGLSMLVYLKRHGVAVHYGWGRGGGVWGRS